MHEVGIVGAGLAGLACARELQSRGIETTVFDKGRLPGGRTAARRLRVLGDSSPRSRGRISYGAQFFTARQASFRAEVEGWQQEGFATGWRGRLVQLRVEGSSRRVSEEPARPAQRFVGTPDMRSPALALSASLARVQQQIHVEACERSEGSWYVCDDGGNRHGPFSWLAIAVPAPQAVPLLAGAPDLAAAAGRVRMEPCLTSLLTLAAPLAVSFDAAFVAGSPLSWIARQDPPAGSERGHEHETWVLHASASWSRAQLGLSSSALAAAMVESLRELVGDPLPRVLGNQTHTWRYARVEEPIAAPCLLAPDLRVGACGDWCGGSRIEDAFLSGRELATRILGLIANQSP